MIEGCRGARLLLEAPQPFRIGRQHGWQDLDRDFTVEPDVVSAKR